MFLSEIVDSFNCAKCGAPLKLKQGEAVIVCDYCGSANSLKADKFYVVKHSWMPNKLSREQALAKAKEWMGGGVIMPPGMEKSEITKAELVYVPLWVFQTQNKTDYSGVFLRGEEKKVEGKLEKEFYWKVLGRRQSSFPVREYKVPLSSKVPFSIEEAMHGEMLNGELDEVEAKEVAKQELADHMQKLLSEKVDKFEKCETETKFTETEFLHVPAWFMEFKYNGKPYSLIIEGTNGEILKGEIPPSDFLGLEMKVIIAITVVLILFAGCSLVALGFLK